MKSFFNAKTKKLSPKPIKKFAYLIQINVAQKCENKDKVLKYLQDESMDRM